MKAVSCMNKPSCRGIHSFVVKFFLANKFHYPTGYGFPYLDKVVFNTFIQDLDEPVSIFYLRSLALLENLTARKAIIKSMKKSLKGKKTYHVAISHYNTLRKGFLFSFIYYFFIFFTEGMDEKFVRYNEYISENGQYYVRIRNITSLPGLDEEFFRWPYMLDCFFLTSVTKNFFLSKYLLRYSGFYVVERAQIIEE